MKVVQLQFEGVTAVIVVGETIFIIVDAWGIKHVRSRQCSQPKTIMSKPFKRHELEQIWQVPKRNKQVELDMESHATTLADLYKGLPSGRDRF